MASETEIVRKALLAYEAAAEPGTLLSFTIDTTNVPDAGGTPDLLAVAILDSSFSELPANGPASEFVDLSLAGGTHPQVSTFGSAPGSVFSLTAPRVQSQSPSLSAGAVIIWRINHRPSVWRTLAPAVKPRRVATGAEVR